jgi:hypothetical protein
LGPLPTNPRQAVTNRAAVFPGGSVSVGASGFRPGAVITLSYRGRVVGTVTADDTGGVVATVVLDGANGTSTLTLSGPSPRDRGRRPIPTSASVKVAIWRA